MNTFRFILLHEAQRNNCAAEWHMARRWLISKVISKLPQLTSVNIALGNQYITFTDEADYIVFKLKFGNALLKLAPPMFDFSKETYFV